MPLTGIVAIHHERRATCYLDEPVELGATDVAERVVEDRHIEQHRYQKITRSSRAQTEGTDRPGELIYCNLTRTKIGIGSTSYASPIPSVYPNGHHAGYSQGVVEQDGVLIRETSVVK